MSREFRPSGFFAFRSPLLPFEELEAWSSELAAPRVRDAGAAGLAEALAEDRRRLRERLAAFLARPEVLEAVFVASPSLVDGLEIWRSQPESKKGQRAERALVRYIYRMASRATPFGLFSGCSVAETRTEDGTPTRLEVVPREEYQRHTRLDMDYLFALCEDLGRDANLRAELLYRPNSSLYRAAGRLRYAEARLDKKVRSHHLVAVEATDYLEATLERARPGALARDLAAALVSSDPEGEITMEEAEGFVTELVDSQVLVSDLYPLVTGPEAIHDMVERLGATTHAAEAGRKLAGVRDTLERLDAAGVGGLPDTYRAIASDLESLPTTAEMARLFQVDMVKPAGNSVLGPAVLNELERAIEILRRLLGRQRQESLERFMREFNERYGEGRAVPLSEALDEEIGIGFERSNDAGAEASPLLQGLALAGPPAEQTTGWGARQNFLLQRLGQALARGERAIELTEADIEKMAPAASAPPLQTFPDSFQAMGVLAAPSPEALAQGDFKLLFMGAGGPSGARLLGRFCHADPVLSARVEQHLRAEEAMRPDAIFAEIVHLPQGRIGNILSRPVLRDFEIPYLGRSGAPEERQIPLTDILVTVSGGRIVLRSAALGREIVPRLTSAHNFVMRSLGVYRFLCALQTQNLLGGANWGWGVLDGAPFLPRVTSGRLVLARATWWMSGEEIKELAKTSGDARYIAVQEWREKRGLERLVLLADGDNELLVDLDNPLSIDTFLDVIEERDQARLHEFFPGPDQLPARGPEGRFVHEILVPFERLPQAEQAAGEPAGLAERSQPSTAAPPIPPIPPIAVPRSFPPGSEWLYAKLYTGTSTADAVLREVVSPLVRSLPAAGWFFIRYGDPEWHLRLRFRGDPEVLCSQVLPALHAAAAPLLADGRLWKLQLDTYEREVERYGGPAGIEVAERLFQIDSEAVAEILSMLEGDEGALARWRLTLRGIDALLEDLGLTAEQKLMALTRMRTAFGTEFAGPVPAAAKGIGVQLDQRFRTERREVDGVLDAARDAESLLAPALEVIRRRSQALSPVIAELRQLEASGRLTASILDLVPSYVHMHVNRMIRSAARAHELVLYDFLHQVYRSRAARESRAERGDRGDRPAKPPKTPKAATAEPGAPAPAAADLP